MRDALCPTVFNEFFTSIFTRADQSNVPSVTDLDYSYMSPIVITSIGINKLINNLDISTSSGADNICSKILKNTSAISSDILCLLFQQSLSSCCIPTDWKLGKIVPIFKSGSKSSVTNYRPISPTSVMSKLLEDIVFSHSVSHLEKNNFFYKYQNGFRKGYSCETQLLEFTHDIHTNMDSGSQTDAIFLDFSKAFDRVPHCRLISKLSALNLDSLTLSWIRNFLTNRQQFTVTGDFRSCTTDVTSGVPQGTVLGPLLLERSS